MLAKATLIEPPTASAVSLAEAKAHLRVDGDDEDLLIQTYIDAATAYLDGMDGILGRALCPQTWRFEMDREDAGLPLSPVISFDRPEAGVVVARCGYNGGVPAPLKAAILLHVGSLYANREQSVPTWTPSGAYEALVAPYRRWV